MKKHAIDWTSLLADIFLFVVGSIAFAVAVVMFTAPNNLAPGGVTGISTLINFASKKYLPFELPIGLLNIAINVPLIIAAFFTIGHRMVRRTLWGILLTSVFIDLLDPVLPPFHGNPMLTAIFGGVLMGFGVGLILSRGGSTGGTEIGARILEKKYPHIPVGRLMLIIDVTVVAVSALVYRELESPMYATVLIVISSLLTDMLVYGGLRGKMAMIVSNREPQITQTITQEMGLGATLLKSSGAYTGQEQNTILCAVHREDVSRLKHLVYTIDPDAFFMLLSTDEVLGMGWQEPPAKK